jgi:hypothetical protein
MIYVKVHQNFVVVLQSVESDSILTWASSFSCENKKPTMFGAPISSHGSEVGNFISLVVEDLLKALHAQVKFCEALELHILYLGIFVATLALGLRPKQGFARVRAKREAQELHLMLPGL